MTTAPPNPVFQSMRRRLALWYAIVTAILLIVFATGFYLYVQTTLIDRIDDTIDHVAEVIEDQRVPVSGGNALRSSKPRGNIALTVKVPTPAVDAAIDTHGGAVSNTRSNGDGAQLGVRRRGLPEAIRAPSHNRRIRVDRE